MMSSVKPKLTTKSIRDRIRAIAAERGGPTVLARAAGLAPSTVTQYLSEEKGRASEPGVEALIKLADAAAVSISWLAAERGPKDVNSFLPQGYHLFPYFDVRTSGFRIHGLHGDPNEWVALKESWFRGVKPSDDIICFDAPDRFSPSINSGDLLAINNSRGGDQFGLHPLNLAEGEVYAIAPEARILLRQLNWKKPGTLIVATAAGSKPLEIQPFQVIGLVVWRGGAVISSA